MRFILSNTAVVKIGTDTITTPEGLLDKQRIRHLVGQITDLRQQYERILIVTSGAMAAGRAELRRRKVPGETVSQRQMYAAIGQVPLMDAYRHFFEKEGALCGQVLLTRADFAQFGSYRNVRNTLREMLANGVYPVINENDTVATYELTMGDNDQLAGSIAQMMHARTLVLLTNVDGVLRDVNDPQSVILEIDPTCDDYQQFLQSKTSGNGTGGMQSKCAVAAAHAKRHGGGKTQAFIGNGKKDNSLLRMLMDEGPHEGTRFFVRKDGNQ